MNTVLVIFRLAIQSSYSRNMEEGATEDAFDTVQFFATGGAAWRIKTFAIDQDVHVWSLGKRPADIVELARQNTEKHYGDVLVESYFLEASDDVAGLRRELTSRGLDDHLETSEEDGLLFWTPAGTEYRTKSNPEMNSPSTKTICYRGGIAEFDIPATWVEEYEPEGGGTFYEDAPNTGTLRLSVLSVESPGTPAEEMARTAFPGATDSTLEGFPLHYSTHGATEQGQAIEMHTWKVAVPLPPRQMRIAIFTYTILAGQRNQELIAREFEALCTSIKHAKFSRHPGVSGSHQHK